MQTLLSPNSLCLVNSSIPFPLGEIFEVVHVIDYGDDSMGFPETHVHSFSELLQ